MARLIQVLDTANHVLLGLSEKAVTALTSRTRDQQVLSCINQARQMMNVKGSFPWDKFFGSIITVDGINSYTLTPNSQNWCPDSRNCANATLINVTVAPKAAASFDDTYNMAKCTATGANPSLKKTTVGTLNNGRVSASVWLKGDLVSTPGTITLTLTDAVGGQSVSSVVQNDGTLQRYGLCAYFTTVSTGVSLTVSFTSPNGVLYIDAWQIENNDWPSETMHNPSLTHSQPRTLYANPDRLHSITPYRYNTRLAWSEVMYIDQGLSAYDHMLTYNQLTRYASIAFNLLNLTNVPVGTHLVYRGNKKAPVFTAGTDLVDVEDPEYWIFVQGAIAYQKAFMYDIGSNKEAAAALSRYDNLLEDMVNSTGTWPGYSFVDVVSPVMMR